MHVNVDGVQSKLAIRTIHYFDALKTFNNKSYTIVSQVLDVNIQPPDMGVLCTSLSVIRGKISSPYLRCVVFLTEPYACEVTMLYYIHSNVVCFVFLLAVLFVSSRSIIIVIFLLQFFSFSIINMLILYFFVVFLFYNPNNVIYVTIQLDSEQFNFT